MPRGCVEGGCARKSQSPVPPAFPDRIPRLGRNVIRGGHDNMKCHPFNRSIHHILWDNTPRPSFCAYFALCTPPFAFLRGQAYILIVGQPTMAINVFRNKRFGPGGGTRRLHQISSVRKARSNWAVWGRNRIDERGKGLTFARHSTTDIGLFLQMPTIMT